MTGLAKQYYISRSVRLDIVRQLQSVQMRHSLEASKVLFSTTTRANILSILQVKLRIVQLLASFEFSCILFLWIREVELYSQWIVVHFIAIARFQVPKRLLFVAVENVLTRLVQYLAVVVLDLVDLHGSPLLFDASSAFCIVTNGSLLRLFLAAFNKLCFLLWILLKTIPNCLNYKRSDLIQVIFRKLVFVAKAEFLQDLVEVSHAGWSLPR